MDIEEYKELLNLGKQLFETLIQANITEAEKLIDHVTFDTTHADYRYTNNQSVLNLAIVRGYFNIVWKLLEKGAAVTDQDVATLIQTADNTPEQEAEVYLVFLWLIKQKQAAINFKNEHGRTLLHLAMIRSQALIGRAIFEILTKRQISVPSELADQEQFKGIRPLQIDKSIATSPQVNAIDNNGLPPLHYAIINQDEACVQMLLGHGADVSTHRSPAAPPLHVALEQIAARTPGTDEHFTALAIYDLIIAARAINLDATDSDGLTALMFAIQKGLEDLACDLISRRVNLTYQIPIQRDQSSSSSSSSGGHPAAVASYHLRSSSSRPSPYQSFTAGHFAVLFQCDTALKAIVEAWEADKPEALLLIDSCKKTILHYALLKRAKAAVMIILTNVTGDVRELLFAKSSVLEKKLFFNAIDSIGKTALHYALIWGNVEVVGALAKRKAVDVNLPDKSEAPGLTELAKYPIHYAVESQHPEELVPLLLSRDDLRVDVQNKDGDTPLHIILTRFSEVEIEIATAKAAQQKQTAGGGGTPKKSPATASASKAETLPAEQSEELSQLGARRAKLLTVIKMLVERWPGDRFGITGKEHWSLESRLALWMMRDCPEQKDIFSIMDRKCKTAKQPEEEARALKKKASRTVTQLSEAEKQGLKLAAENRRLFEETERLKRELEEEKRRSSNSEGSSGGGTARVEHEIDFSPGSRSPTTPRSTDSSASLTFPSSPGVATPSSSGSGGSSASPFPLTFFRGSSSSTTSQPKTHFLSAVAEPALHKTVRSNDKTEVSKLLLKTVQAAETRSSGDQDDLVRDIDERNSADETALHIAAANGNIAIFDLLIAESASLTACDCAQNNMMHKAVISSSPEMLEHIYQKQSNLILAWNHTQQTPAVFAASQDNTDVVLWFIDLTREGLFGKDYYKNNVMDYAFKFQNIIVLNALFTTYPDTNFSNDTAFERTVDDRGNTLLHACALNGSPAVAKKILAVCSIVCIIQENAQEKTALHIACAKGHDGFAETVLQNIESRRNRQSELMQLVNAVDFAGNPAIFYAIVSENKRLVQLLLQQYNPRLDFINKAGMTIFHFCAQVGDLEMAKFACRDHSTLLAAQDAKRRTPWHVAAQRNDEAMLTWLMETTPASDRARILVLIDTDGNTVLDYLVSHGNIKYVELLLKRFPSSFPVVLRRESEAEKLKGKASSAARKEEDDDDEDEEKHEETSSKVKEKVRGGEREEDDSEEKTEAEKLEGKAATVAIPTEEKDDEESKEKSAEDSADVRYHLKPLITAIKNGNYATVELLMKYCREYADARKLDLKKLLTSKDETKRSVFTYAADLLQHKHGKILPLACKISGIPCEMLAFIAVEQYDLRMLNALVNDHPRGVNRLEAVDTEERTPLHLAIQLHPPSLVSGIITLYSNYSNDDQIKAYIRWQSKHGLSALHFAAQQAPENIQRLFDALLKPFGYNYATIFSYIHEYNDQQLLILLADNKAALEHTDTEGRTLLHYAANVEQFGYAALLVQKSANLGIANLRGETPLYYLASHPKLPDLNMSNITSAEINTQTTANQDTALHRAIPCNEYNRENALFLLKHGADPTIQRSDSKTALHVAAELGRDDLVPKFIADYKKRKANLDVNDTQGRTALHLALSDPKNIKIKIAKLLIAAGASLDAKDKADETPRAMIDAFVKAGKLTDGDIPTTTAPSPSSSASSAPKKTP